MKHFTETICGAANRIYLAAEFASSSASPETTRLTVREAVRTGQDLLARIDPSWLRTLYATATASFTATATFQASVSDLLQTVRVHQIPVARLGSILCAWDGTCVPYSQLGDSLDTLDFIVNHQEELVCNSLLEQSDTMLLPFSDAFYGLAILIASLNSPHDQLRGYRQEIASAAAKVVLDSSQHLSHTMRQTNVALANGGR